MASQIYIRTATSKDLPELWRMERDSPTAAHWTEADYARAFGRSDRLVLVAEDSGEISGFLIASTATVEWELENIAVVASCRRRGIGRSLVGALISRAREAGAVEIRQEIRTSNLGAQSLGRSVGFVERGRRKGYYRNPDEDALLFNYLLNQPKTAP